MGSDKFRVPRRNKSLFIYLPIGGCYNNNCPNSKLLSAFNIIYANPIVLGKTMIVHSSITILIVMSEGRICKSIAINLNFFQCEIRFNS